MGTYYRISYSDSLGRDFQTEIDHLFQEINLEVSTYIDSSFISHFNRSEEGLTLPYDPVSSSTEQQRGRHFYLNYEAALEVFEKTQGAFDPTVMPLVNYWGFGYSEKKKVSEVDSLLIDSLMQFVGFEKLKKSAEGKLVFEKEKAGTALDFSGCAKGYAVDEAAWLLHAKGISNYLVDIGGEVRAQGESPKGEVWKIGINVPREGAGLMELQASVSLQDQSLATSGNYRNFYEVDGIKYSHTINPWTGFPERNSLLSASVFARDCMKADAYATAFMVLGLERAYQLAAELPELEAYFIFGKEEGSLGVKFTDGLKKHFNADEHGF